MTSKRRISVALLATLAILPVACGGDDEGDSASESTPASEAPSGDMPTGGDVDYMWTPNPDILANAEGQVNFVAWAGYAEDGSTDPAYDRMLGQRQTRQFER